MSGTDPQSNKTHKWWFGDVIMLLLGAGSFALWFFFTTMLTWVVTKAITNRSEQAVVEPLYRQFLDFLQYSVRITGTPEATPAIPAHCINLALFVFNLVIGWRWISRGRSGRFALLLIGELLLAICGLYALALHIASSPYALQHGAFGL